MKEYKMIRIPSDKWKIVKEMKTILIEKGYNSFPKEFIDFLEKNDFVFDKLVNWNIIRLCNLAIRFLMRAD